MSNPIGEKSGLILNGNILVSSKRVKITFSLFGLTAYFKLFRRRLEKERGTLSVLLKISFIYLFVFCKSNCCLYLDDEHFETKAIDSLPRTKVCKHRLINKILASLQM